jgi:hypothetical protein
VLPYHDGIEAIVLRLQDQDYHPHGTKFDAATVIQSSEAAAWLCAWSNSAEHYGGWE